MVNIAIFPRQPLNVRHSVGLREVFVCITSVKNNTGTNVA